ncbi:ArsR/SmtB family transcription factor [Halobellus captivus]|uniref:ArsR/SmtB family transcription factor n=1 Tax=Halobellus captivus TaxID=2592614 RepID=UPI0011A460C0|nr:winged helix-turn-helix domain-containing protein [Halobellus captivus]
MADILPSRPDVPDDEDKDPRVVGLDSDEVDELLAAIGSQTARETLAELHDEPGTPSEVASRVDTSIQNAQYHLGRLETAGLIESAGTAYSEKGREMTVYAPADRALVVVAGTDDDTTGLQSALTQLLGGLGVVALGSVIVDRLARTGIRPPIALGSSGADGGTGGADGGGGTGGADGGSTPGGTGGDGTNNLSGTETDAPADSETATSGSEPTGESTSEPTAEPTNTPSDDGGGFQIAEATDTPGPEATSEPTAQPTPEPTDAPTATDAPPTETVAEATRTAADMTQAVVDTAQSAGGEGPIQALHAAVSTLPPGAFFFTGGLVALVLLTVWQTDWMR